jgi:hypothetical protein
VLMTVTHPLNPSIIASGATLDKMGISPGCKSR